MISSLTWSDVSTWPRRASSWAALRSNERACSRRFIQDLAFAGCLELHVARRVSPVLELLRTHHEQVHGDVQGPQQATQPHHLLATVGDLRIDHHYVEVTVFRSLAARLRTKQNDGLRLCRSGQ